MRLRRGKSEASGPITLPGRSQTVTLSTASGARIPARVTACGPRTLMVAIMVPTKPFSAEDLDAMVLEYSGPHGRVRLRGSVIAENPAEPDLLRVEDPCAIEVSQEREYVRIRSARPALVYSGLDQLDIQSYTVDISGGGLLLAGPDTLEAGEQVRFRLTLTQGEPPVAGSGRVVRIDSGGRRAVAFEAISDLDRRRLIRFIFECQRIERRRSLEVDDGYGG